MPQVLVTLNDPVVMIADTEAGLATGVAIECPLTALTLTSTPNLTEVPQTGCYPPTSIVGDPTYALDVAWLQDWPDPAGVSRMTHAFNGDRKWISFLLDADDATTEVIAETTIAEGSYGGTFGGLAVSAANWPINGNPTFPVYTPAAGLEATEADTEAAEPATV